MAKKIVLYSFPPVPYSYSMSPFGLKAEAFLRINNIPYEMCYTSSFGKNGTIPYLRLFDGDGDDSDGIYEEVSDSNEIINRLLNDPEFDTALCEHGLTHEQKAIAHTCLRMLEEHTAQTGFYFRYALQMPEFCEATELRERVFMGDDSSFGNFIFNMFKKKGPEGTLKKAKCRGFTRYSNKDAVWSMSFEDLKALEDILVLSTNDDNNKASEECTYFFGRSNPSVLDCAVFGHLSQFLYIRIDFPQKKYLNENCPGLLRFMEYFKNTHFPDWESKCQKKPNESLREDSPRMQAFTKKMRRRFGGMVVLSVMATVGVFAYHSIIKPSRQRR